MDQRMAEYEKKQFMDEVLSFINRAFDMEKAGDAEGSEKAMDELKAFLDAQIETKKADEDSTDSQCIQGMPHPGELLGTEDSISLYAFCEKHRESYLETAKENSLFSGAYNNEDFCMGLWEETKTSTAHYFAVENSENNYIGYVAIKDTSKNPWEIAIEILSNYRYHGNGEKALTILFRELKARTGVTELRSRVRPDNYASQALMDKLGAVPNGYSELYFSGDTLEKFRDENPDLIDDNLRSVATKFGVTPRELVGCILEYRIHLEDI